MSKTLTPRDNQSEVIIVTSEIAAVSRVNRSTGRGGSLTVLMKSGKEIPLWFNSDEPMYRLQRILAGALS